MQILINNTKVRHANGQPASAPLFTADHDLTQAGREEIARRVLIGEILGANIEAQGNVESVAVDSVRVLANGLGREGR